MPIDVAVQHCAALGYDGFVDMEIRFMVQRRHGYGPLAVASRSYAVLARAFEQERKVRCGQPRFPS